MNTPANYEDLCVYVRSEVLTEAGEPLPQFVIDLIHKFAGLGWWPLSFGECGAEGHEDHTELWFCFGDPHGTSAKAMADHFIFNNGND